MLYRGRRYNVLTYSNHVINVYRVILPSLYRDKSQVIQTYAIIVKLPRLRSLPRRIYMAM